MTSCWTVAASECHGGYEQSCAGFWHWPSNPKKQLGVYKPRLSYAQLWWAGQRVGERMLQAHELEGKDRQWFLPPTALPATLLKSLKRILKVPKAVKLFQKCQNPCLVSASFFIYETLQPHSSSPLLLQLSQSLTAPGKLCIDHSPKNSQPWGDFKLLEDFSRMERAVGLGQEDMGWVARPAHPGVPYKANPKEAAELRGDWRGLGELSKEIFQFTARNFCETASSKALYKLHPCQWGDEGWWWGDPEQGQHL